MNDLPRKKLREIVKQYGQSAVGDARRCRALLLDFCGGHRREIFVLTTAQEEQVPEDLQEIPDSVPLAVLIAQLTQRLVDNRALDEGAARWAVESWAYALDMNIDNLPQPEPPPIPTDSPVVNTASKLTKKPRPAVEPVVATPKPTTKDVYTSPHLVEVYGRPRHPAEAKWQRLGATPGNIRIPKGNVIGLRPSGIPENEFSNWVNQIPNPVDVTSLELSDKISDANLFTLSKLPNLTYLEINKGEALTDQGLNYLTRLPKLITLNLSWCTHITDEGLAYFRALVNLVHLNIAWANISDNGLSHLRHLGNLTTLALRECKHITGNGLTHLSKLSRLTRLELPACTALNDSGLRYIGNLQGLRKLDLSRCLKISRQGIVHLRSLNNLSYLDLAHLQIGDAEMAPLCDLPALASLNLSHTQLTNRGLGHIGDMINLIYLDLSHCENINDNGLDHLRHLDKLAYLNLSKCPRITHRALKRLKRTGLYILQ